MGPARRGAAAWISLLALPLLVLLSESLFGGKVLSQSDALLAYPPWNSVAPEGYRPRNPLLLDQALLMRPWLGFAAERVAAGELPLWNPYNFCGQPITAAVTGATYWPLHWVYYAFPTPAFHGWSALVRLFATGAFTLLFLRRIGVSAAGGAVGAAAFMLSGFMVAWLNHPHTNVALCLPLVLWQVERLAERPDGRRTVLLGACLALPLLGGHLQTSLHVFLAVAAWVVFRCRAPLAAPALGARGVLRVAAAGSLALLLAAPQLLPFVEYYLASQGRLLMDALDPVSPFDRVRALRMLVQPDAYGGPHTGDYTGPSGFNVNYNELVGGFVGRAALLLAGVGAFRERRSRAAWFFLALALVSGLVALRVFPFYETARAFPIMRSTKLTRLLLLVAFGLAVLAAMGVDALVRGRGRRSTRAVALVAFALVSADLVAWGRGYNPAIDRSLIAPPSPLTEFLAREDEPYRVLGVRRTYLYPNANLFHRIPMVSGYDSIEYAPTAELVALLSRRPFGGFEELVRSGGEGASELRASFVKGIRLFDREEALPLASLLGVKYYLSELPLPPPLSPVPAARSGALTVWENPDVAPRAFAADGWELVMDPGERLERLGAAKFDRRIALLEEPPPRWLAEHADARGAGPAGEVVLELYEPRRLRLRADMRRPGVVVVADAWDPGWSAWTDGGELPIARVDHALRGIFLPAGSHVVELLYDPASTRLGLLAAALGLVLALLTAIRGATRGRARAARPAEESPL